MKKQQKIWLIVLVVITLAAFSTSCTKNHKQSEERVIKIGVIAPLSGGPALWGQGSLNLINLAVDEINQTGGIDGKKLIIIAEDGKCQSQPAVDAAKKLINVDQVKFILGGHCSPETIPIVPIADANQVFMIANVTAANEAVSKSDFAFRTTPPTLELAQVMAKEAFLGREYKSITTLTESAAYAESITMDFVRAFKKIGGKILNQEVYAPSEIDFRSHLNKINQTNPDAIFISPQDPLSGINILKQMQELDLLGKKIFGNTIFVSQKVSKDSGLLPQDAFSVVPYTDTNSQDFIKLNQKYTQRYGTPIPYDPYHVGASYDAVYMLAEAIKKCDEDTTCVKNWFDTVEGWPGVVGEFTFKANGDPIFDSWAILTIEDGESVFEVVE